MLHRPQRRPVADRKIDEALLKAAEHGAHECDDNDRLPLHVALWHGSSSHVVRLLVEANPAAVREASNGSEWLPLHIALHAKAPSETILLLLQAYPDASRRKAAYGWLPLHVAARRGADDQVLEALHNANCEAIGVRAESGDTPLMLARKNGQLDAAYALQKIEQAVDAQRQEDEREAEKRWWAQRDEEHRQLLEATVRRRDRDARLVKMMGTDDAAEQREAHAAAREAAMREAMRQMHEQLEKERAERKYQVSLHHNAILMCF